MCHVAKLLSPSIGPARADIDGSASALLFRGEWSETGLTLEFSWKACTQKVVGLYFCFVFGRRGCK